MQTCVCFNLTMIRWLNEQVVSQSHKKNLWSKSSTLHKKQLNILRVTVSGRIYILTKKNTNKKDHIISKHVMLTGMLIHMRQNLPNGDMRQPYKNIYIYIECILFKVVVHIIIPECLSLF